MWDFSPTRCPLPGWTSREDKSLRLIERNEEGRSGQESSARRGRVRPEFPTSGRTQKHSPETGGIVVLSVRYGRALGRSTARWCSFSSVDSQLRRASRTGQLRHLLVGNEVDKTFEEAPVIPALAALSPAGQDPDLDESMEDDSGGGDGDSGVSP